MLTLVALLALAGGGSALSGWAFLANQTDCRMSCQNDGVCAFDRDAPHRHKCICFVGMFYGEQCEFTVSEENANNNVDGGQPLSSLEDDEATANGALKAGVSSPDGDALTAVGDADAPYVDTNGIGGNLDSGSDAVDAVLPDEADDHERVGSRSADNIEEPSYESESALKDATKQEELTLAPSTSSDNYGAVADEVELLRNEEARNRDAYSLDGESDTVTVVSTRAVMIDEQLRSNVIAPISPSDVTVEAPHDKQRNENEQQLFKQQQLQAPMETTSPLGAGGNFLAANDEFHDALNIKRYEEQSRTTQTHYIPSAAGADDLTTIAPHQREKTRRKHYRARIFTTTPAPTEAEYVYDDGWMISAKGRRGVDIAPSSACHSATKAWILFAAFLNGVVARRLAFRDL